MEKLYFLQNSEKLNGCWKPNGEFGECGQRIGGENIVGGKRAKKGDFPYMALIGYESTAESGSEVL